MQQFGSRLRALRERRNLTQEELARQFGFRDRQTISAIENGTRKVSAEELVLAVEKLGVPLEYFTDPFRLDGDCHFSWRQQNVDTNTLRNYESKAGRWIAAFRHLAPKVDRALPSMRHTIRLSRRSSYRSCHT